MTDENEKTRAEIDAYLANIRKTIAESEHLVSQVELRVAETDRLLASQGLTREQLLSMRIPESQVEAVNEELRRRGLDPIEESDPWDAAYDPRQGLGIPASSFDPDYSADGELAERSRKFSMMMKPFQI